MKDPVQNQDAQLFLNTVPAFRRLLRRSIERDRDVTRESVRLPRRERKYVCGLILLPEDSIQVLEFSIRGDETRDHPARHHPRGDIGDEMLQFATPDTTRGYGLGRRRTP